MGVSPSSRVDQLTFFEVHNDPWSTHAVAIGTTVAAVNNLKGLTATARQKYTDAMAARDAAKAATQAFYDACDAMRGSGADIIATIKAYAETTNNPGVYTLAQIPAPAGASSSGPPEIPADLVADPNADGSVTLKWKGSTGNQTFFSVWRKSNTPNAQFTQIGAVAAKSFIDVSAPAGVPGVTYAVRAHRTTQGSLPSDEAVVNYGQAA